MKDFPQIKTEIKNLVLEPLNEKHIPFLVELLSSDGIQRTLFRSKTKIDAEKEHKAVARMYDGEKPKEITYILTLKKLLHTQYFGYVKVKIIDWTVKSCYLSVATFDSPEFRGKGYVTASYNAFFDYLFSLGFMKIYGRTYENNSATIALNIRTGFRYIGKQSQFMLYPDKTSLDAHFFEKLNPTLREIYPKQYNQQLEAITKEFSHISELREKNLLTTQLLSQITNRLSSLEIDRLVPSIQRYVRECIKSLQEEASYSSTSETEGILPEVQEYRTENAKLFEQELLGFAVTTQQFEYSRKVSKQLIDLVQQGKKPNENIEEALLYTAYTPENWSYLNTLFLSRDTKKTSILPTIAAIKKTIT